MSAQNSTRTAKRRVPGRPFAKGTTGNPGGRPKGLYSVVQDVCGKDGRKIIELLWAIASADEDICAQHSFEIPSNRERIQAMELLLDRGWGKAQQTVEVSGDDGGPVQLVQRVIVDASSH